MKLKPNLIVLSDHASLTQEGKVNILGVFDVINIISFPGGIARAFFVAVLEGKPHTNYNLQLLVESKGKSQMPQPIDLIVRSGSNGKVNILTEMVNFVFPEAGEYHFAIFNGSERVGSTTLTVHKAHTNEKPIN